MAVGITHFPGSQPAIYFPLPTLNLCFSLILTAFIHWPHAHGHLDFTHGCGFLYHTLPRQLEEEVVHESSTNL